jgi:hypothetical protein
MTPAQTQGIVRCNHCKLIVLLEHRKAHALDCAARKRSKKLDKVTFKKDGCRLYAIAAARWVGKGMWAQEIHYAHAESVSHARAQFCLAEPNRRMVKILEVGLAIGWEVNEKTGEVMSS